MAARYCPTFGYPLPNCMKPWPNQHKPSAGSRSLRRGLLACGALRGVRRDIVPCRRIQKIRTRRSTHCGLVLQGIAGRAPRGRTGESDIADYRFSVIIPTLPMTDENILDATHQSRLLARTPSINVLRAGYSRKYSTSQYWQQSSAPENQHF
jgi:hypothetical protein